MWIPRNAEGHGVVERLIAVAIDKDKGSEFALKWAVDNLVTKGQTLVLVHVNVKSGSHSSALHSNPRYCQSYGSANGDLDPKTKDLFLPFLCFCMRTDIQCLGIVLEGTNVVEALVEFVSQSAIEILVLGAHPKGGFLRYEPPVVLLQSLPNWRMKSIDIPCNVTKAVPDFCNVYVISSNGKISSTRSASRPAPAVSPLRNQIQYQARIKTDHSEIALTPCISTSGTPKVSSKPQPHNIHNDPDFIKAALLPLDMEREKGSSYDALKESILESSVKVMQKASAGFDRAKETEKELKREVSTLQKRAEKFEKESTYHSQQWKEAKEEADKLRAELVEQKRHAEEAEQNLRQQLVAAQAKAEAEYDRAVIEVTNNYRAQMPVETDAIWETSWTRCLTKVGVPEDSPHGTDVELPSQLEALAAQAQLNAQAQLEPPPEQPSIEDASAIVDLTHQEGDGNATGDFTTEDTNAGSTPDGQATNPTPSTDAQGLSEEA